MIVEQCEISTKSFFVVSLLINSWVDTESHGITFSNLLREVLQTHVNERGLALPEKGRRHRRPRTCPLGSKDWTGKLIINLRDVACFFKIDLWCNLRCYFLCCYFMLLRLKSWESMVIPARTIRFSSMLVQLQRHSQEFKPLSLHPSRFSVSWKTWTCREGRCGMDDQQGQAYRAAKAKALKWKVLIVYWS